MPKSKHKQKQTVKQAIKQFENAIDSLIKASDYNLNLVASFLIYDKDCKVTDDSKFYISFSPNCFKN